MHHNAGLDVDGSSWLKTFENTPIGPCPMRVPVGKKERA
eukprot:CAMPEP_0183417528 /NCGR_PEP_ID=MMETSP0370-20130417/24489_1 /TAXON_ID=268820 /ORGANISM="Peridinium aciculiferum, Strain PAER-2" /LENGTH=38 /DNA_ID= /DNA_START= /DNA_END= /DNA_ORIENTATION=